MASRPGVPLLVLRAFLGVTFCFAGLQKLANPNFFRRSSPGSFSAQLAGSIATSPLHHLLSVATHAPTLVAVLISSGELAVGLGTLFGLFSRVAAVGGMLLSLTFFLTVSFNDSPYYYGPDIVFLFAWTPLLLSTPGWYSFDALLARRAPSPTFALGEAGGAELDRRAFLERSVLAGALGFGGAVLGVLVSAVGRHFSPTGAGASSTGGLSTSAPSSSGSSASPSSSSPAQSGASGGGGAVASQSPKGTRIGLASAVPVGGAASFTDPAEQIPAYVLQPSAGHFIAFSAVCTHAGCTVAFERSAYEFACPCHGSVYNASTGAVIRGPAALPLPQIAVALGPGDELYADG
jgi:thiosulfate dehydrogenase [quinone] large subunit